VWDAHGRIHDANDRFLEMLGYERGDLEAGRLEWSSLTPAQYRERDRAAMERLERLGIARAEEREYVRRDGALVFARLHSTVLDEEPVRFISIVVDVSEQNKAAVEQRSLMERETQARAEAENAVRSRDDVLAIVSHDLRNPLNIIAMSAAVLDKPLPDDTRAAQVGIIRRAVAGMNRLIGDLLDVTQITSGKLRIEARPVRVSSICEDTHAVVVPLLAAKSQQFECVTPSADAWVLADRERISQVLSNLIGNAHKFTPEGGNIALRVEIADGFARFVVDDTGPGVSVHDLPHIFDRFWQARRVRRGGVGLGLPITKGIVDAHGGRIWAKSAAGIGSTFYFTLPLAPPRD
jgi:PAS domain S-box-containing protein